MPFDHSALQREMQAAFAAQLDDDALFIFASGAPGSIAPNPVGLSEMLHRANARARADIGAFSPHAAFGEDTH